MLLAAAKRSETARPSSRRGPAARSLEIARQKADLLLEGETLLDSADLPRATGDVEESAAYLERARDIFELLGDRGALVRAQRVPQEQATPAANVES
ncbi:hypothetical protein BH23GEM6_BH23GEM6_08800 [soil metagenome]